MTALRVRLATALAASALALAPGAASAVGPSVVPTAAEGACTDAAGVTVVVDARALGGVLSVRCVSDAAGLTGLDALKGAGFSVEGTQRFGESFVCRIAGLPSATQKLDVDGTGGYRETCVDTPPAAASWSYYYARNGGGWQYSSSGVKAREVIPGGFEGWVFSLNRPAGSPALPGVTPVRDEAPNSGSRDTSSRGGGGGRTGNRDNGGGDDAKSLPAPRPRPGASAPTTASTTAPTAAPVTVHPVPASATQEPTGSRLAPFVAGGLVVVIASVAAVTARRRARRDD